MNALKDVLGHLSPSVSVIAIDGRSASGKTSLASCLEKEIGASVIHMDDFFLPPELRTEERYSVPGGNVHSERFCKEVLPFLRKGGMFSYRRFDCSASSFDNKPVIVDCSGLVVVEGAYSMNPVFGKYYDLSVFMDVAPDEQMRRIVERNGAEKAAVFASRWIPLEEMYIKEFDLRSKADIVYLSE